MTVFGYSFKRRGKFLGGFTILVKRAVGLRGPEEGVLTKQRVGLGFLQPRREPAESVLWNSRRSRERGRRVVPKRWKHFYWRKRRACRRSRERHDEDRAREEPNRFAPRHLPEWKRQERARWYPACSRSGTRAISDAWAFSFCGAVVCALAAGSSEEGQPRKAAAPGRAK